MFMRAPFMCPMRVPERPLARAARTPAARRRRTRKSLSGMGIYEYDKSVLASVQQWSNWTWGGVAYGDSGTDASRTAIHDLIVSRATAMRDAGLLSDTDAGQMIMAADGGSFVYPSLTAVMSKDPITKTAYYKMMAESGLHELRRQVLWMAKKQVLAEAKASAASAALWDAIATPMEYVSGAKAIDKLNEILSNIRGEVQATNALLTEAQRTLSPERYAQVVNEAKAVSAQLAYLEKYVPGATQDTGLVGLAWVQAAVAIAIGVAIGVASICWAYVASKKTAVANKLAEMTEAQRRDEVAAAEKTRKATEVAADAAVRAGEMTEAQAAEVKQEAAQTAEGKIAGAGERAEEGKKKATQIATSAGAGLFGIDFKWVAIAGAAAIGLMILPQVMGMFPKKSAAPTQA